MGPDKLSAVVEALVDLVAKLRGPGGCPWDAKQTDSTIKLYLLEEAYEVLDAIESGSPPDVCQELGDLLFHIFFLARLAEERGEFDIVEVVKRITEKMVRRHPHVFGNTRVGNAEDVADNWARIKKQEKKDSRDESSPLNAVPTNLPGLLCAHRLGERVSMANNDFSNVDVAWDKVLEGFEVLKAAVVSQDRESFAREVGTYLFSFVNLVRLWGLNSENLLRAANKEFKDCFEKQEREPEVSVIKTSEKH